VQATSAPLDDLVIPERALRAAFILDVRYGAVESGLVRAALRVGTPAADGLGMLVRQAAVQARLFTDRDVPFEVLWEAAREAARIRSPGSGMSAGT
jgi:shikimate 5-dehydrogenase